MSLRISFAFLCDDVRREDNGKLIFLGVYSNDIVVRAMPANLVLALVLWLEADAPTEATLQIRCRLGENVVSEHSGSLKMEKEGRFVINLPGVPIMDIKEESIVKFDCQINESGWEEIFTIPIVSRHSTA